MATLKLPGSISLWKSWISIAMLVYRRVDPGNCLETDEQWKKTGWLDYIVDYTTQLFWDYKPL